MPAPIPLSESEIAALRREFPALPEGYLRYLRSVGGGEARNGRMIYSRPMAPHEVYGLRVFEEEFILLGDDTQGYCLAVSLASGALGELSPRGAWEAWPSSETFDSYVSA